jgi:hypothetical protein
MDEIFQVVVECAFYVLGVSFTAWLLCGGAS